MKRNRIIFCLLSGLIALTVISCSTNKKSITVLNKGNDSFASIEVKNQFGNNFIVSAGENGAIGYEIEGKTNWLKGVPDVSAVSENETKFVWENNGNPVTMLASESEKEVRLVFSINAEVKPSCWILNYQALDDEYFTGVFERVVDGQQTESWKQGITAGLNLRGQKMDVKLKPTVSAYSPFYISSENYAVFVQRTWPGTFDFCTGSPDLVQMSFEGPELSFSIMTDETPAKLVQRHALATGPSIVPPKWALGPWRWRDEHFQNKTYFDGSPVKSPYNSDITEDILMMEAYGIPCTAYWIDRPWGPGVRGFDDYLIDEERLPEFEKMIPWLNKKGVELMLWIGPFVMGEMADVAEEQHYELVSKEWMNSRQVLMDFTNPEACKWWGENGPAKLAKMGVKGFKLDRADGEKLFDSLHLITSAGTTYRENYNDYPRQYVKATYDAVKKVLNDDFVLFPRAQYTGSAKYGAMWAGDTGGVPEGLRSAVIGMQRCAVMGYPVWGSDAGGYWGGFSSETAKRWIGFACFSPIMEVGPTQNRGFWNLETEPVFDAELLATWRFYTNLRMSLVDYLYGLTVQSHETGMPVVRPLFLEYPEQKEAWDDWQTYKLGADLLVSVNWKSEKTTHKMYLPAGETWLNLWEDEKEYEGGQFVDLNLTASQTAVFIKKGSELQLPDFKELWNESQEITSQKFKMNDLETKEGW